MSFDRLILSTDENKKFIQFVCLVVSAWRKFFPQVKISIAFVTDRPESDSLVLKMRRYADDVRLFKTIDGIPTANLAKISRHILAGDYPDQACVIHDMDSLPLQIKYHQSLLEQRKKNHLLAVGAEVYEKTHPGKFPSGHMTAEGHIFKALFNPKNLAYPDVIESFRDLRVFDHKEAASQSPDVFSDESLIRAMIHLSNNSIDVQHVRRNVDIRTDWIDRSWWKINKEKLFRGDYTECNLLRPFEENFVAIEPIVEYIYGSKVKMKDVVFSENSI